MGAGQSKDGVEGGKKFADEFYGKSHKRLERSLRKHFAQGIKYNSKRLFHSTDPQISNNCSEDCYSRRCGDWQIDAAEDASGCQPTLSRCRTE